MQATLLAAGMFYSLDSTRLMSFPEIGSTAQP